ncbi:MAG: hypothetical protein WBP93_14910 [Pyrinomonadaceae bacterium]
METTPFTNDHRVMSIQTLSALENAIEPYRQAGYVITSQSEMAMTLQAPARRFSWMFFLLSLLIVWPVAVIYLVWFNQRRDMIVCMRVTSQGEIEETGFIIDLLIRERRRQRAFYIIFALLSGAIIGLLVLRFVGHHVLPNAR